MVWFLNFSFFNFFISSVLSQQMTKKNEKRPDHFCFVHVSKMEMLPQQLTSEVGLELMDENVYSVHGVNLLSNIVDL